MLRKRGSSKQLPFDYTHLVQTRHSIRRYTGESSAPERNQTSGRPRSLLSPIGQSPDKGRLRRFRPRAPRHMMIYQYRNNGFRHKLGAVLVITTDLREFDIMGERNQAWIDGGLFTMALTFALHAESLGTCMLNWAADKEQDKTLRCALPLISPITRLLLPCWESEVVACTLGRRHPVCSQAAVRYRRSAASESPVTLRYLRFCTRDFLVGQFLHSVNIRSLNHHLQIQVATDQVSDLHRLPLPWVRGMEG